MGSLGDKLDRGLARLSSEVTEGNTKILTSMVLAQERMSSGQSRLELLLTGLDQGAAGKEAVSVELSRQLVHLARGVEEIKTGLAHHDDVVFYAVSTGLEEAKADILAHVSACSDDQRTELRQAVLDMKGLVARVENTIQTGFKDVRADLARLSDSLDKSPARLRAGTRHLGSRSQTCRAGFKRVWLISRSHSQTRASRRIRSLVSSGSTQTSSLTPLPACDTRWWPPLRTSGDQHLLEAVTGELGRHRVVLPHEVLQSRADDKTHLTRPAQARRFGPESTNLGNGVERNVERRQPPRRAGGCRWYQSKGQRQEMRAVSGLLGVCLHVIEDKDLKALTWAMGSSVTTREDSPHVELEVAEGISRSASVRR